MPEPADWPEPVDAVNEGGTSDTVLLCEHASNHMPAEYGGLGLPPSELQRHIAWDIGAAAVTRRLCDLLDAAAFLGTYSRLLIDLNRPLDAPDSIPQRSESTDIPGNVLMTAVERLRRRDLIFMPYHRRVSAHLDSRQAARRSTRLLSIHSFTPTFLGQTRPWHAGVLFIGAVDLGHRIADRLRGPDLLVGINEPYKTDRRADYGIPVHGDDRGIAAVMMEIRNDLIRDPASVEQWASAIGEAL
ncbi:MAG: N-formylglutamate amidohydrolase [Devosia sp.]